MDAVASKSAPSTAASPPNPRDSSWRQALRLLDYPKAAQDFDRVHPEPELPELRFVRAKLAFELGQFRRLHELCPGLPEAVPRFAEHIRRWCELAALELGAAPEVAERLSKSSRLDDALAAVERLIELQLWAQAREASDRLLERAGGSTQRQARVRRQRAKLLEAAGDAAAAVRDYRWLALSAPTEEAAQGADAALERLSGKPLTKRQRYERAEAFTKSGALQAVQRELERLASAPGPGVSKVEQLRTLAWAHYRSRSDYQKASELFSQCAQLDNTYRTQDTFYSARALSRAHRDEEAIVAYEKLIKRWPNTNYAEEARFLIGRLRFVLGQWDHAVDAHSAYLAHHTKGARFGQSARYERALAELARGRGTEARSQLLDLTEATKSERERAMLQELTAVAYLQEGKTAEAAGLFASVMAQRPLSFAALMSEVRLRALGQTPPPAVPQGDPEETKPESDAREPLRVELPESVSWLVDIGLELEAERELQRVAPRLAEQYAPRGGEAVCLAYGQLTVAQYRYRHAQKTVRERALQRAMTPATQWLWDCIYPTPYAEAVRGAERRHGVYSGLVHAVMRQESAFAPHVESPAKAVGLMQLIPPTARSAAAELGWEEQVLDLRVPAQNIELGAFYLGKLLRKFGGSAPLAAAGYNAGPGAAARWLQAAGDLPLDLFVAYIPYSETRNYVRRVMGNWARYTYLTGGLDEVPELSLELPNPVVVGDSDY